MAAVICKTHGRQLGGPNVCEHILDAGYGREPSGAAVSDPGRVVALRFDFLGDGFFVVEILLCHECANRFGRVAGEVVNGPESIADDSNPGQGKALPWVCPICPACLESWLGRAAVA